MAHKFEEMAESFCVWTALLVACFGIATSELYSDEAFTNLIVHYEEEQIPNRSIFESVRHVRFMQKFDGFAAIEVETKYLENVMSILLADNSIHSIEEDSVWTEQGILEDQVHATPGNIRRLQTELENYGIEMVQGDAVQLGQHPVKVCLVDTGVVSNHPDLDYSLLQVLFPSDQKQ